MRMAMLLSWMLAGLLLHAEELTQTTYAKWRDYILPKPQELAWLKIPWRNNLWEAAIEANQRDKPVLLWTMNGHPLGCT
ncbi:MAG: hypothetical protein AB1813_15985 [Verrucomicrobiota bacterium]